MPNVKILLEYLKPRVLMISGRTHARLLHVYVDISCVVDRARGQQTYARFYVVKRATQARIVWICMSNVKILIEYLKPGVLSGGYLFKTSTCSPWCFVCRGPSNSTRQRARKKRDQYTSMRFLCSGTSNSSQKSRSKSRDRFDSGRHRRSASASRRGNASIPSRTRKELQILQRIVDASVEALQCVSYNFLRI